MIVKSSNPRSVLPARTDPIRIVPLHLPELWNAPTPGVSKPPPPLLTYRGGPLLAAAEVFTIFWGAPWGKAPYAKMSTDLNQFFKRVLRGSLMKQMAEYSVPAYQIGLGKWIGSTVVTKPRLGHSLSDNAIRHMLQQEISTNSRVPKPNPNLLYFVYVQPGVTVVQGGSSSCQAFCGYHDAIDGQIFYAAMPYPNCRGCLGSLSAFDALTSTSSHELCEAITDAIPGQGWYDDRYGEVGDICAWKTKKGGGYTLQLEWTNKATRCA